MGKNIDMDKNMNMDKKTAMENVARTAYEKGAFNGTWLYAENGVIVSKGAVGFRDAEDKLPMREDARTVFLSWLPSPSSLRPRRPCCWSGAGACAWRTRSRNSTRSSPIRA